MTTDRMAAALSAVAHVERPHDDNLDARMPDASTEAYQLMGARTWFAFFLAGELTREMGVDLADVIESLRQEVDPAIQELFGGTAVTLVRSTSTADAERKK